MIKQHKSNRNRTITVSDEEIPILGKYILSDEDIKNKFVDDCVINANLFDCIDFIPNEYFNLIIIDPPYNLDKNFHGNKFTSMKAD